MQSLIARYSTVDVVIIVACGERAGEVVETINEYRVCLTHATSSGRDSVQCYTKTELYQKQILTYNEVCCVCVLRCVVIAFRYF